MAREIFAKMSGTLDGNRKIRKAGRNGREVFLWVMRQVAIRDSDGVIPVSDVTDFAYVADQLMCSEEEAREGFASAVTASLLSVTGDSCSIVGWDDDWSRRAQSNGERQAKFREKRKASAESRVVDEKRVTEAPLQVTANVTSNVVEERRGEESRVEREHASATPPAAPPAAFEFEPPKPSRPRKRPATAYPDGFSPGPGHVAFAREFKLDLTAESERFRLHHVARGTTFANWDAALSTWLHKALEFARPPAGHAGSSPPRGGVHAPPARRQPIRDL